MSSLTHHLQHADSASRSDHWDHLFITNCCKSLTLHNFDGPPATILDVGCGRGLWAIEAGRLWQVCPPHTFRAPLLTRSSQGSTIVGFDVQPVQPKLGILDKNLSRRLKWVHGNLYCARLSVSDVPAHILSTLSDLMDCLFWMVSLTL